MNFRNFRQAHSRYSAIAGERVPRQEAYSTQLPTLAAFLNYIFGYIWQASTLLLQLLPSRTPFLLETARTSWARRTAFFHHDRWRAVSRCLIHIPPIAVTITILVLNARDVYYEDVGAEGQGLRLNGFQFAAKIHELLILWSLSIIAISLTQFELLDIGLPLDGVLAGFQISSFTSFWSLEIWREFLNRGVILRRLGFMFVIAVMAALAATAGPSSAILMLPTTGWWRDTVDTNNLQFFGQQTRYYLPPYQTELWPSRVTEANFLPQDCNFTITPMPAYCPAAGLQMFADQAGVFWSTPSTSPWNFTVPVVDNTGSWEQFISGAEIDDGNDSSFLLDGYFNDIKSKANWFYAQATSMSMARILRNAMDSYSQLSYENVQYKYTMSLYNKSKLLAPQALVLCNSTYSSRNWTHSGYAGLQLVYFPRLDEGSWQEDASQLLNSWNFSYSPKALWMAPGQVDNDKPPMGIAFVGFPYNSSSAGIQTVACSIYASWHSTEIYTVVPTDNYVHSSTKPVENENTYREWAKIFKEDMRIDLDLDWVNSALPLDKTIINLASNIMNQDPERTYLNGWVKPLGWSLSLLITDALSRYGENINFDSSHSPGDPHTNKSEIQIDGHFSGDAFKVGTLPYGYGYTLNSMTRVLGSIVLLIHIFAAAIHSILVVWFGWDCSGLNSIHDLLVATINSPSAVKELERNGKSKQRYYTVKASKQFHPRVELKYEITRKRRRIARNKQSSTESSVTQNGTDDAVVNLVPVVYPGT